MTGRSLAQVVAKRAGTSPMDAGVDRPVRGTHLNPPPPPPTTPGVDSASLPIMHCCRTTTKWRFSEGVRQAALHLTGAWTGGRRLDRRTLLLSKTFTPPPAARPIRPWRRLSSLRPPAASSLPITAAPHVHRPERASCPVLTVPSEPGRTREDH